VCIKLVTFALIGAQGKALSFKKVGNPWFTGIWPKQAKNI